MNAETAVITAPMVALVGNPNAGKSALFNALTGARQKVGNYPGVTVERHVGRAILPSGAPAELIDLPGSYGLDPNSPDEAVTRDVLLGRQAGERLPDALLIVLDAAKLEAELGVPVIETVAVRRRGIAELLDRLETELGHQRAVRGSDLPP